MTDLELFKEVTRAVTGVPIHEVSKALAKVRALLAKSPAQESSERGTPSGRNRKYLGGFDRGGDEAA